VVSSWSGLFAGRARVPARREPVCVVDLTERSIGSVLGFANNGSRGRDPSHAAAADRSHPNLS